MLASRAAAVAIGSVLVAAPAAAQPGTAPPVYRQPPPYGPPMWVIPPPAPEPPEHGLFVIVAGQLGLGTPVGAAGIEVGLGWRWFRVVGGIGAGFKGRQDMAMVRVLRPSRSIEVGLGAGLSRGAAVNDLDISLGESSTDPPTDIVSYGPGTVWINFEVFAELRVSRELSLRSTLGYAQGSHDDCRTRPSDGGPTEPCSTPEQYDHLSPLPYVGVAVAWRRGL